MINSAKRTLISINALSKSLKNNLIFENINFEVAEGEVLCVCGESGSGKTTLLQIIGTLDTFSSGSISILEKKIQNLNEKEKDILRKKNIGFIYQFHHLCKEFSSIENIILPLLINGIQKNTALKIAEEELKKLKMLEKSSRYPNELSGGEKQRIAIARAIIHNPKIILADEPTGNLDPLMASNIFNLIIQNTRQKKSSAIIATHNHTLAKKCDKIFDIQKRCFI